MSKLLPIETRILNFLSTIRRQAKTENTAIVIISYNTKSLATFSNLDNEDTIRLLSEAILVNPPLEKPTDVQLH